jgi:hypothetical protein
MAQGDNIVAAMLTAAVVDRVPKTLSETELPDAIVRLFFDIETALSRGRANRRGALQQRPLDRLDRSEMPPLGVAEG